MSPGRTPVRTCVGCRERAPKGVLVRIVAGVDGPRVDASASALGRGAYVHPARACVELAARSGALHRALRTGPAADELDRLMLELERMGAV